MEKDKKEYYICSLSNEESSDDRGNLVVTGRKMHKITCYGNQSFLDVFVYDCLKSFTILFEFMITVRHPKMLQDVKELCRKLGIRTDIRDPLDSLTDYYYVYIYCDDSIDNVDSSVTKEYAMMQEWLGAVFSKLDVDEILQIWDGTKHFTPSIYDGKFNRILPITEIDSDEKRNSTRELLSSFRI